jgi:hypothetical protein
VWYVWNKVRKVIFPWDIGQPTTSRLLKHGPNVVNNRADINGGVRKQRDGPEFLSRRVRVREYNRRLVQGGHQGIQSPSGNHAEPRGAQHIEPRHHRGHLSA